MSWADREAAGLCRRFDAFAMWREIETTLELGRPLSDDAKEYLLETARRLSTMTHLGPAPPKETAEQVAAAIGLPGAVIASHRREVQADLYGTLFHLEKQNPGAKSENIAGELAAVAKVSPRQIFRWGTRKLERLMAFRP